MNVDILVSMGHIRRICRRPVEDPALIYKRQLREVQKLTREIIYFSLKLEIQKTLKPFLVKDLWIVAYSFHSF